MFRALLARHPRGTDVAVAITVLVLASAEADDTGFLGPFLGHFNGAWFLVVVVSAAALLLRRSRPLTVFLLIAAADVLLEVADRSLLASPAAAAVYALAVYRNVRTTWISTGVLSVITLVLGRASQTEHAAYVLVAAMIIAALIGINVGNRKRYMDALLERAAQLARERDQNAQLATAAERARIARELHDVVAHSLSVVVRLADGSEAIADADPPRSREAVRQIGEVGRTALTDMRRLLGVLREGDEAELAPQPTLGDLDRLVETYRNAGLPVAVRRTGTIVPAEPLGAVLFRTVQESLTNALRYAVEPTRVLVSFDFTPRALQVEVLDDGAPHAPGVSVGAERGLIGLRERAALYGGTVEAGPRTDVPSGWRVRLTLPTEPSGDPS